LSKKAKKSVYTEIAFLKEDIGRIRGHISELYDRTDELAKNIVKLTTTMKDFSKFVSFRFEVLDKQLGRHWKILMIFMSTIITGLVYLIFFP